MIASSTKFLTAASCSLLMFGVSQAADSNGACNALPASENVAVVDVPTYASTDEAEPSDPKAEAFARAWADYQNTVVESLKSSPDPRDWAIAGSAFPYVFDPLSKDDANTSKEANRFELLKRASEAVPDDALVQWMAIEASHKRSGSEPYARALQKLEKIEPENAAVWDESLIGAGMKKDKPGVSAALRRMSATSRFDIHFSDVAKLVMSAYERNPIPDSLLASLPEEFEPKSKEALPLIYATAITSAFALPAFQFVVTACRTDSTGRNADRVSDCSAVGHLMVKSSDTLLGTRIGFAILRVSHTYTDEDVEVSRNVDWIYEQFVRISVNGKALDAKAALAFHRDWVDSGSELEAMGKAIERDGISIAPPTDWVDKDVRFSAELAKQDENYFVDHAIAY